MLSDKGRRRNRVEAVILHDIAQLDERIVIGTIAKQHDGNARRTVSLNGFDIGQQQVRNASGIDRHTKHHQLARAKFRHRLPCLRKRKIIFCIFGTQLLRDQRCRRGNHLFRCPCGAEINRRHSIDCQFPHSSQMINPPLTPSTCPVTNGASVK